MRISIKDYAAQQGVTYEAVRQQLARYEKELVGHIHKEGRRKFLDEYAAEFLAEKREKNPVTVITNNYADELAEAKIRIQELELELKAVNKENKGLYNELVSTQKALIEEQKKVRNLLEAPKEPEQPAKKGIFAWFFGG